jgi:hypothetical protein
VIYWPVSSVDMVTRRLVLISMVWPTSTDVLRERATVAVRFPNPDGAESSKQRS